MTRVFLLSLLLGGCTTIPETSAGNDHVELVELGQVDGISLYEIHDKKHGVTCWTRHGIFCLRDEK